jgi:hypothetical protein
MAGQVSVLNCAQKIHDILVSGPLHKVTYRSYEPDDQDFVSDVAVSFGFQPDQNDRVLKAIESLKANGAVLVDSILVKPSVQGSHGKMYPAEYKVTVELR